MTRAYGAWFDMAPFGEREGWVGLSGRRLFMFTVCPKCALTLVVTAADLRVAQGYVRCGRCSNVFNALARLSEDRSAHRRWRRHRRPSRNRPPPAAERA